MDGIGWNTYCWGSYCFFLALFQIISQKSEIISLGSKLRRLQIELDSLRNQAIDDDIILSDDSQIEIIDNE